MKYRIVVVQTWSAEVTADSADEAYEKYHNKGEYDSLDCLEEKTVSIDEVGGQRDPSFGGSCQKPPFILPPKLWCIYENTKNSCNTSTEVIQKCQ